MRTARDWTVLELTNLVRQKTSLSHRWSCLQTKTHLLACPHALRVHTHAITVTDRIPLSMQWTVTATPSGLERGLEGVVRYGAWGQLSNWLWESLGLDRAEDLWNGDTNAHSSDVALWWEWVWTGNAVSLSIAGEGFWLQQVYHMCNKYKVLRTT